MIHALPIPSLQLALLGWSPLDYWLLLVCGFLLVGSAFFSGSETALFGMSQAQRRALHQQSPRTARIVDALLENQRMLLITVMIGNMTINALYFVISSVLMMSSDAGATGQLLMAFVFLLVIVLVGEVLPKMLATSRRFVFVGITGAPLFALHTLIKPLRIVVNTGVITPLNRLTAPTNRPPELSEDELHSLLDISGEAGVIDEHEQEMLRDVLEISRYKVRDVMTPRVRMHAIPDSATAEDVRAALMEKRLTKLPVYANDLDNIVGVLHVKRFLLDHARRPVRLRDYLSPPRYVPVMATLEQLLLHFQQTFSQSAIVVDEFGGTAGIVSVEDVVEELVGDITRSDTIEVRAPRMISPGTWEVDGDVSIHDWAEAFGATVSSVPVATLGGLITHELGRVAEPNDIITIGNVEMRVEIVDGVRIQSVIVRLIDDPNSAPDAGPTDDDGSHGSQGMNDAEPGREGSA